MLCFQQHNNFIVGCCRYYNLDAYYKRKLEKEIEKGVKKIRNKERTVFNDEEQRRYVIMNTASFVPY